MEEVKRSWNGSELPVCWTDTAKVLKEITKKVLAAPSG